MPYETKAGSSDNHSFALNTMWVGFAGSLWLLASELLGSGLAPSPIAGVVAGSLMALVFIGRQDEYFQRLVTKAAAWACAVVGLWLFASAVPRTDQHVTDHELGLAIVAVAFHVSFAISRLRGA
jgi:hypothetical protein